MNKKRVVRLFAMMGMLALLMAMLPGVGAADQMSGRLITWTPKRLVQTVKPGETVGVDVTLSSTQTISDVTILPTPSLSRYVTVTPSEPMTITEGVTVTVHLSITVPSGVKGMRAGVVKVKDSAGNTIPSPLHVKIVTKDRHKGGPGLR